MVGRGVMENGAKKGKVVFTPSSGIINQVAPEGGNIQFVLHPSHSSYFLFVDTSNHHIFIRLKSKYDCSIKKEQDQKEDR